MSGSVLLCTIPLSRRSLAHSRSFIHVPYPHIVARTMTDLTVLYIPNALPATPPTQTGLGLSLAFPRARRTPPRLPFASTPMVTLEMVDLPTPTSDQHALYRQPISPVRTRDHSLLSPPPNSFTSRPRRRPHPTSDRSVPPRPASAPPLPPPRSAPLTPSTTTRFSFDASGGIGVFEHPTPRRIPPSPYRERAPSELVRPAPPLCTSHSSSALCALQFADHRPITRRPSQNLLAPHLPLRRHRIRLLPLLPPRPPRHLRRSRPRPRRRFRQAPRDCRPLRPLPRVPHQPRPPPAPPASRCLLVARPSAALGCI